MRLPTLRAGSRAGPQTPTGVRGPARIDSSRTGIGVRRGDVAVIDHVDLDARHARELVGRGAAAVVNAAPCLSGRYPARGAQVLVDAGIPLVDDVGREVFAAVRDGRPVTVDGDVLRDGDLVLARGEAQCAASVAVALEGARAGLLTQTEAFTATAAELLRRRPDILLEPMPAPDLRSPTDGRPVLLVLEGAGAAADLRAVLPWAREARPLLVGVGGGAQVLLEAGLTPEVCIGAPTDLPAAALRAARDVVVPRPPGVPPPTDEGLAAAVHHFPVGPGGEHAALLLADALDAPLIVQAGALHGVVDLLDQGRSDMAATVLARLRVDRRLVDAYSVAVLHRRRLSRLLVALLLLAALALVAVTLAAAGDGHALWHTVTGALHSVGHAGRRGWHRLAG